MRTDVEFEVRPLAAVSRTLSDWLQYQEQLHPRLIDLGLDRLKPVLERLGWRAPTCPVITVGGTNGKGSCVALLASILTAAGYRVGTFTSPHLVRYNERIRLAGREVSDRLLIDAFEQIEAARGEVSLTFFEFNTLAALLLFTAANLDVWVLEVGLGGRLDATNVVDADVALLCSVALDHCEWLGDSLEKIGAEKAGIFRFGRAAIFGDRTMPSTVQSEADRIGARLIRLGADFDFHSVGAAWSWRMGNHELVDLPPPALRGRVQLNNAAAVLAVLNELRDRLPITALAIAAGLQSVFVSGRFQGATALDREWILDVAHNPAAAAALAANLSDRPCAGRTIAVFGMLADKDVTGVVAALTGQIDAWVPTGVEGARALAPESVAACLRSVGANVAYVAHDVAQACDVARQLSAQGDRIVVFGSFHTVGPALDWLGLA